MVHESQRLPLRLEASDDLGRIHPRLDDLQRHPPAHRAFLLGVVDNPHPAFAELLEKSVPVTGCSLRSMSLGPSSRTMSLPITTLRSRLVGNTIRENSCTISP